MTAEAIFAALPTLNAEGWAKLAKAVRDHDRAVASLQGKVVSDAPLEAAEDWLLTGIVAYMKAQGVPVRFRRDAAPMKSYYAKRPMLTDFLLQIEQQLPTQTKHRLRLATICAEALGSLLREYNIFSPRTMLSQIDRIPEAIERAYPGYITAGLFRILIEKEL